VSNAGLQVGFSFIFDDDVHTGIVKAMQIAFVKWGVVCQGQEQTLAGVGYEAKALLLHNRYVALSYARPVSCHTLLLGTSTTTKARRKTA